MTKAELVSKIAEQSGLSKKDSETALTSTIEVIKSSLSKGEKIALAGFGTFEVRDRKARMGHNPKTGEKIQIPAQKSPAFKAGKALKEAVR